MNTFDWGDRYELGVEDIDLQHHYFLNLLNHIVEAIEQKKDKIYIKALVNELDAYAKFHFTSEERMMVHSDYPEYETHKQHHLNLIQVLGIEQYKLINATEDNEASNIINFFFDWFNNHTQVEDKLFAEYLLNKSDK
jgi:hemerythrin-like metal-binding protein